MRQFGLPLVIIAALTVPLGLAQVQLSAQQPDIVHSQVVSGRERPTDLSQGANPGAIVPIVKWPKAGTASVHAVEMTAAESRAAVSKGESVQAGSLPVWVGPGSSGQREHRERGAAGPSVDAAQLAGWAGASGQWS